MNDDLVCDVSQINATISTIGQLMASYFPQNEKDVPQAILIDMIHRCGNEIVKLTEEVSNLF